MQDNITIARPYAQAVFSLAKETNTLAAWATKLRFLKQVVNDPLMAGALKNPAFGKTGLSDLIISICGDALDKEGQNFVTVLVAAGRLSLISEIETLFEQHKAASEEVVECRISSAYALSDAEQRAIADAVATRCTNKRVMVNSDVDSALIGGAVIHIGDAVIDLSIKGRLKTMEIGINN